MRIGILKCDSLDKSQPSEFGGQEERMIALLHAADPGIVTFVFDVAAGDYPFTPDFCDGYVCLGSESSVYDPDPWIAELGVFVRDLFHYEIPLFGICFGHQMIALALGGEVTRVAPEKGGYGIVPLNIGNREVWMRPFKDGPCQLVHYHGDQVTKLPEGAVLLGSSPHCPNALFRVGSRFIGIQAHPEMTSSFVKALIQVRAGSFTEAKVEELLEDLNEPQDGLLIGEWLVQFFENHRHSVMRARPGL